MFAASARSQRSLSWAAPGMVRNSERIEWDEDLPERREYGPVARV